jgi:hypothetical protein
MHDAFADRLVEGTRGIREARLRGSGIPGADGRPNRSDEVTHARLDGLIALAALQALPMSLQGRCVICHEGG